jgi:hypothetical protein
MTGTVLKTVLAAGLLAGLAQPALAKENDAAAALAQLDASLPGDLVNDPTSLDWSTQGSGLKVTNLTGESIPGGGAATRYNVRTPGENPWSVQVYVPLTGDIANGDTVTFGFWARSAVPPEGRTKGALSVRIQANASPWPGFGDTQLEIEPAWKWYEVSATANLDVSRKNGVLVLQIGGVKQEIEIGQAIVVKGAGKIIGNGARPQEPLPPQIDGKGQLISQPDNRDWTFFGPESAHAQREDSTIYLASAIRVTAAEKGANPWDIHANVPIAEEIKAGDKLLIAVAAKTVSASTEDGKAVVGIRVQKNEAPYDGFADNRFKVGPNWQLVQIQTTATMDIPQGNGLVVLSFAGEAQVVDIGPTYVIKLPPAVQ